MPDGTGSENPVILLMIGSFIHSCTHLFFIKLYWVSTCARECAYHVGHRDERTESNNA